MTAAVSSPTASGVAQAGAASVLLQENPPAASAVVRAGAPSVLIRAPYIHIESSSGIGVKTGLFAVCGASAGDVVDLYPWFSVIKRAGIVSATGSTVAETAVTNGVNGTPTALTIPAGPSQDGLWLIAIGVSA